MIHRDLKSENILVDGGVFKIADFGLAKSVQVLTSDNRGTVLGSRFVMAPEVLYGNEYSVQVKFLLRRPICGVLVSSFLRC